MPCNGEAGVTCGCGSAPQGDTPWDEKSAMLNQGLMSLPILIGGYAIAKSRPRRLVVYLSAVIAFMTYWRRFICARCQYYGQPCSTMLGVMTAHMMPRDETKQLDRNAMIADFAFIGLLTMMPLRDALKRKGLGLLYVASVAAGLGAILTNACERCGNDFCPMKDVRARIMSTGA